MPYVIRAVDNIDKWNLENYSSHKLVKADPIGHLKTTNNELSVFVVDDITNINHIAIALATTHDRVDFRKFHCVIAEKSELKENRILMKHSPEDARTPVDKANQQHWNLVNLKARDLEKLAKIFLKNVNKKGNFKVIPWQSVRQLVESVIDDKSFIEKDKVNTKLLEKLNKNKPKEM